MAKFRKLMHRVSVILTAIFIAFALLVSSAFAFLLVAVPIQLLRILPYAISIYVVYLLFRWAGAV